jgi:hypothetical protein
MTRGGKIIASTAGGDSTLAFAAKPRSLPFGIDAARADSRFVVFSTYANRAQPQTRMPTDA